MELGYARVSTTHQDLERQARAALDAGQANQVAEAFGVSRATFYLNIAAHDPEGSPHR